MIGKDDDDLAGDRVSSNPFIPRHPKIEPDPRRRSRAQRLWRGLRIRLLKVDLARARLLHDQPSTVDDLLDLGLSFARNSDLDRADRSYAEAREKAVRYGHELSAARAGIGLAANAYSRGDFPTALELYKAELPRLRALPEKSLLVFGLVSLAETELQLDRFEQSELAFREAEQIARRIGDWQQLAHSIYQIGRFEFFEGDYQSAQRLWTEALSIYRRHGDHVGCGHMQYWLSLAAAGLDQFEEARQIAADCVASYERSGWLELAQHARAYLADIDTYLAQHANPDNAEG